jgi:hypothetical protein
MLSGRLGEEPELDEVEEVVEDGGLQQQEVGEEQVLALGEVRW